MSDEVEASMHSWVETFPGVLPSPIVGEEGFSPSALLLSSLSSYHLPEVSTILPGNGSGGFWFWETGFVGSISDRWGVDNHQLGWW